MKNGRQDRIAETLTPDEGNKVKMVHYNELINNKLD